MAFSIAACGQSFIVQNSWWFSHLNCTYLNSLMYKRPRPVALPFPVQSPENYAMQCWTSVWCEQSSAAMGCRSAIASSSLPDFPVSGLAGLAGSFAPTLGSKCVAHIGEPHLEARTTIIRASSILTKAWSRDDRQGLAACEARSLFKITFVPSNINGKSCLVVNWAIIFNTSSTAQGGGGSFKNKKPIGEVGCCESGMAERSHWWTERCLRCPLFLSLSLFLSVSLSFSDYLPTYWSICLSVYLSVCLSISLSIYLSTYLSI